MPYSQMAKHVQSRGRGQDTMLVHMTPDEVGGLQNLAKAAGGSLTINPHTGLPEAGFLSSLLPMLGGVLLDVASGGAATPLIAGISNSVLAGGAATLADTAITGSLSKGLMAGLGAFGGASLGGALGVGGAGVAAPGTIATTAADTSAGTGVTLGTGATTGAATGATGAATGAIGAPISTNLLADPAYASLSTPIASTANPAVIAQNIGNPVGNITGNPGFMQQFSANASNGLTGTMAKIAPAAAGMGIVNSLAGAFQGSPTTAPEAQTAVYKGPYHYAPRTMSGNGQLTMGPNGVLQTTGTPQSFNSLGTLMDAQNNPYVYETAPISSINQYGGTSLPGYASGGPITQPSTPNQTVPQPAAETTASTGGNTDYSAPVDPYANMQSSMHTPQWQAPQAAQPAATPVARTGNNPNGLNQIQGLPGISNFASGGAMPIKDGSFIVDARTVSELGNGSSSAGQDLLARYGGHALRGPGDGVSDSIPANIGGTQKARVARDEVKFDPEAITRLGNGSHAKGTNKLYALMDKAEKARKKAKRGQDTGLRKGLA